MELENINTQPKAYILIGLPGSGKSTWMLKIMQDGKYIVISTDDEIEKFAKSLGQTYSQVFHDYVKTATYNMNENLKTAISNNDSIIWDQTNMSVKKRKSILQRIPKHYNKVAVIFELDATELKTRLDKRAKEEGKFIPQHVIDNMQASYELPTMGEGYTGIIRVSNV